MSSCFCLYSNFGIFTSFLVCVCVGGGVQFAHSTVKANEATGIPLMTALLLIP